MSEQGRVYIHEFIDIRGMNRAKYIHHMTANWSPEAQEERGQLCFGVWSVVGSTGRWPQVVNMWELTGWDSLAGSFALEAGGSGGYDARLARWWAHAAELRRGGVDRIAVAAPWSRSIVELCRSGVSGAGYAHELVRLRPGSPREFLLRVHEQGELLAAAHGWQPIGAFRTAMANDDECILLWAFPEWSAWAAYEAEMEADSALAEWRRTLDDVVVEWRRIALIDAPLSPLRTGRQPRRSDQVDWKD